ncbi:MAG: helix-turn-helix domain-containing protein [Desulfobacterales bacterium]|nr:helix-turn-helix domain-containing protein [Desulfobacterales bacterium]
MNERWLSVAEIADHLGVSKDTIYRWLENRKIPAHRIGKFWKFKQKEVDDWVMAGKAAGTNFREGQSMKGTKSG